MSDDWLSGLIFGFCLGVILMGAVMLFVVNRTRIVYYGDRECVLVAGPPEKPTITNCYYPERTLHD